MRRLLLVSVLFALLVSSAFAETDQEQCERVSTNNSQSLFNQALDKCQQKTWTECENEKLNSEEKGTCRLTNIANCVRLEKDACTTLFDEANSCCKAATAAGTTGTSEEQTQNLLMTTICTLCQDVTNNSRTKDALTRDAFGIMMVGSAVALMTSILI
eukprot:GDKI01009079.1.p1 GENE.GDKI01009079.1~~GDKI01009079.1.p1  ORF type:complete len:158 (-),score=36.89 GDKI01009079.1:456-929(-)